MRHKLNALLLYKYQHSKATRELAEVRQALTNLQKGKAEDGPASLENGLFAVGKNLPAGFTSASALGYAGIRSAGIRQVGGRNRNSTSSGEYLNLKFDSQQYVHYSQGLFPNAF